MKRNPTPKKIRIIVTTGDHQETREFEDNRHGRFKAEAYLTQIRDRRINHPWTYKQKDIMYLEFELSPNWRGPTGARRKKMQARLDRLRQERDQLIDITGVTEPLPIKVNIEVL
jgi:hypothetical protein